VDYVEFCSGRPAEAASGAGKAGAARPGSRGNLTA
jgi:hypothetical protein